MKIHMKKSSKLPNPTSTTMFKAIIAMKTRNPIIFAFHPSAQQCSVAAAKILRDAAIKAGAPENCIQWIEKPSVEATKRLMNHEGVALVLATGGAGIVKSAHVKRAVNDLILSKTFDNGMICASEQAIIVDKEIYNSVKKEMQDNNCYFVTEEERIKLEKLVINENTCAVNSDIVGKSAHYIASLVGIKVPEDTKIFVAEIKGVGAEYPVLACIKANSREEEFKYCEEMLNIGGLGHSAVIHSTNKEVQKQFGLRMKACRLIVNSPSA